jgi:hypothetical protein
MYEARHSASSSRRGRIMRKLYTQKELAGRWDCSEKTLERRRSGGNGCPFVMISRRVYYREEDIEAFEAARVRRSTSEPAPNNAEGP